MFYKTHKLSLNFKLITKLSFCKVYIKRIKNIKTTQVLLFALIYAKFKTIFNVYILIENK